MKKKKHHVEGKIIPFPNLEERLAEKGMDALENKKFNEALEIFEQVSEMTGNPDIEMGIIVCLYELGELAIAKQKCKKMLNEDIGDYYKVLQIYITICIQQGEYEEIQTIIEAVIDENKLPAHYAESLFKILDFSRRMNKDLQDTDLKERMIVELDQSLNHNDDLREQWNAINGLRTSNMATVLPVIEDFLQNHKKHPMLKTMILELLKDHDIDKKMVIEKFGEVTYFNPIEIQNIHDQSITNEVLAIIDEKLFNKNPTLFEVVKEVWLRYLFVLYPFPPHDQNYNSWAAALYMLGCEMHGIEMTEEHISQLFEVKRSILKECYNRIVKIEEISFLQF